MNDFLVWVIAICAILMVWGLATIVHLMRDILSALELQKRGIATLISSLTTHQSSLRIEKRSDPYPARPRPKAAQHYEGQGTPRKEPGSHAGNVTASGTPVRIGRIARRRAGGSIGDSEGS